MNEKTAMELVESVFNFENVGKYMMKVRKNLDNEEYQQKLAEELQAAVIKNCEDSSPEVVAIIAKAAEERVKIYVAGAKGAKGTGCG